MGEWCLGQSEPTHAAECGQTILFGMESMVKNPGSGVAGAGDESGAQIGRRGARAMPRDSVHS